MISRRACVNVLLLMPVLVVPLHAQSSEQPARANTVDTGVINGGSFYIEVPAQWNKGLVMLPRTASLDHQAIHRRSGVPRYEGAARRFSVPRVSRSKRVEVQGNRPVTSHYSSLNRRAALLEADAADRSTTTRPRSDAQGRRARTRSAPRHPPPGAHTRRDPPNNSSSVRPVIGIASEAVRDANDLVFAVEGITGAVESTLTPTRSAALPSASASPDRSSAVRAISVPIAAPSRAAAVSRRWTNPRSRRKPGGSVTSRPPADNGIGRRVAVPTISSCLLRPSLEP